jgi:hypothetical protein
VVIGTRLQIALLGLALGCATRPYGSVSIVSTRPDAVRARVLATDVKGEHCRSGYLVLSDKISDYGMAVQDAISSVAGADTLLDASVRFVVRDYLVYQKWCIRVSGSAAVFE